LNDVKSWSLGETAIMFSVGVTITASWMLLGTPAVVVNFAKSVVNDVCSRSIVSVLLKIDCVIVDNTVRKK